MIAWDATARADLAEARMAELGVNPISGQQAMLPVRFPKLSFPTVEVADALPAKLSGVGTAFDELAERLREGIAAERTPAAFAVDQTIVQLDAWLATPIAEDPLLNVAQPPDVTDAAAAPRSARGGRRVGCSACGRSATGT